MRLTDDLFGIPQKTNDRVHYRDNHPRRRSPPTLAKLARGVDNPCFYGPPFFSSSFLLFSLGRHRTGERNQTNQRDKSHKARRITMYMAFVQGSGPSPARERKQKKKKKDER